MKRLKFSTALLLTFVIAACSKMEPAQEGTQNIIKMTISVGAEDITRVSMSDEGKMAWEGDESIGVLIGNSSSSDAATSKVVELKSVTGYKGVFSGNIDLGSFTTADIRGIVYPYDPVNSWVKNKNGIRLVMKIGVAAQTQKENGVFVGKNAPLFAVVGIDDFTKKGQKEYVLEGKKLSWGCSVVKFLIYGKKASTTVDEYVKSITLSATSAKRIAGTAEWQIASNAFAFNGAADQITVNLEEHCTIADKGADDAVVIYMATLPRADAKVTLNKVTVTTDKATYSKTLSYQTYLKQGEVQPFSLDIASFD